MKREHLLAYNESQSNLTINIVRPEGNFDAECIVGVFNGGQCEVREGLLGKVGHHSLCKTIRTQVHKLGNTVCREKQK